MHFVNETGERGSVWRCSCDHCVCIYVDVGVELFINALNAETEYVCIPLFPEDTSIIFFWKSISWSKSDVEYFPLFMQKKKLLSACFISHKNSAKKM